MKNRIYLHSVEHIFLLIATASCKYALRDKSLIFDSLLAGNKKWFAYIGEW